MADESKLQAYLEIFGSTPKPIKGIQSQHRHWEAQRGEWRGGAAPQEDTLYSGPASA